MIDIERKDPMYEGQNYDYDKLDLKGLDLKIDVADINLYPNEQYAILRKHGLGTSDSSILCGVNPYTTLPELIQEKARNYLTEEEKAVGNKVAVKKGRDLEPVIIDKFSKIIGKRIVKPSDMYVHANYPWLKFNFDGVIDKIEGQYIPAEIKVVTQAGLKHYNAAKAWFRESQGFLNIPEDYSKTNNSIETKASLYGIPPYYYTQLQQQIFGLKAPYGHLTVLLDSYWEVVSFFVWRDDACIKTILTQGWQAWEKVCKLAHDPNREDVTPVLNNFKKEAEAPRKTAFTKIAETEL